MILNVCLYNPVTLELIPPDTRDKEVQQIIMHLFVTF